jgi:hypothetical protein
MNKAMINFFAETLTPSPVPGQRKVNRSIFQKRLTMVHPRPQFSKTPHCMYFYYLRVNASGRLKISHFFYEGPKVVTNPQGKKESRPIPYDKVGLDHLIRRLAKNARRKNPTNPAPQGGNLKRVRWTRKSYIVLFLDEANWSFHRKGKNAAFVFLTRKERNGRKLRMAKNYSFFDGMVLPVEMPVHRPAGTDVREALVFVNHMKRNDSGDDLRKEKKPYQFNIFLDVKFEDGRGAPMLVILDPGGTNMGPPDPPPQP